MDLKIKRSEASLIGDNWILLYGRRKVGKTYLLKNFVRKDEYILIGREGTIWLEGSERKKLDSFDELADHVKGQLEKGKRIVIDEFQRAPMDQMEWISTSHPSGQLILSGSSMSVVRKVLGTGSPILGKVKELGLDLIRAEDLFGSSTDKISLDKAPYLSDPWTIPFFGNGEVLRELYNMLQGTSYTVPALVGEIFHAEERTLSKIYQGILSSIGAGKVRPGEIATDLYNKGLITRDGASQISPYLESLKKMGIIEEIRIFRKKRKIMRFTSPVMTLYYYMESKYGLERDLPPYRDVEANLKRIHSFCMEHYLAKAFARKMGGELRYSFDPEIDGVIVDRKEKPLAVLEVKWKDLRNDDVKRFIEKTDNFDCERILLTRERSGIESDEMRINNEMEIIDFLK